MKINILNIVLTGAAVGLAGCISSTSDSDTLLTVKEAALQVFATRDDDTTFANLLEALEDGPVYAKRVTTAGFNADYDGEGAVYALSQNDFNVEVASNGDREITFTIEGVPYNLTEADEINEEGCTGGCYWEVEVDGFYLNIYPVREEIDGVYDVDSGRYMQAFGYYLDADTAESTAQLGYAMVGLETRTSELDDRGDATATYSGNARFDVRAQGVDWNVFNSRGSADISMTADFGANTISGEGDIYQVRVREGSTIVEDYDPDYGIIFEETAIQGNAFSGDLNPDAAMLASEDSEISALIGASTYSGAFYGPTGSQIGGVASGTAVVGESEYLMYGTFEAFEAD
jgi:hypothetical protein